MFTTPVLSFYRYGHEKLGYILEQNLKQNHPLLNTKLQYYLKQEPGLTIEKASSWADQIKRQPKYCWTPSLHYINIYTRYSTIEQIEQYCKIKNNICLYNGILSYSKPKNIEEFKFLIHLTQDLFQPLHTYGRYRGGNSYKVTIHDRFKNGNPRVKNMSMHTFWDDYLIKKQFRITKPEEYIKNHTEIDNKPLKTSLMEIINNNLDLSYGMVYNFDKKSNNIYMDTYYHQEYEHLINEYLTFMKGIIKEW